MRLNHLVSDCKDTTFLAYMQLFCSEKAQTNELVYASLVAFRKSLQLKLQVVGETGLNACFLVDVLEV